MKYDHLKLKILDGEFKYLLLDKQADLETLLKNVPHGPMALFRTVDEISAIIPSEIESPAKKTEPGWICLRIIGEMPFGTVQGLIAEISGLLAGGNMGICVVSTFLTDWFFVKSKNSAAAIEELKKAGWKFVQ
jgi:hypothetical protein